MTLMFKLKHYEEQGLKGRQLNSSSREINSMEEELQRGTGRKRTRAGANTELRKE